MSLEFLLPHKGKERVDILSEVDKIALYHYKLKVLYEDKIRRRFGRTQGQHDADAEDQATKALVDGVIGEIGFGDLVQGDAADAAAEETDEGSSDDISSSDYETASDEDEDSDSQDDETESDQEPRAPPLPEKAADLRRTRTAVPMPAIRPSPSRSRPPDNRRAPNLKPTRSMTSLNYHSRSSQDSPVPPLPPLPRNTNLANVSKPLPPSPQDFANRAGQSVPRIPRSTVSPPKKRKAKDKPEALKPPELTHIPELLPVFKEMVLFRPHYTNKSH